MSTNVVHLNDYRGRRQQRFRRTVALYGADRERSLVVQQLWAAAGVVGADRGAALWVDEYGPGLVHVHTLLDLASDQPRRGYSVDPLNDAWSQGIPGLVDYPGMAGGVVLAEGPRSLCALALGSDGVRAWFLVLDSVSRRTGLSDQAKASLMFIGGECASVLLHRDLPLTSAAPEPESEFERKRRESFAAWPVLQDIEGREGDEEANRRIAARFLVARVVRGLLDDDFATEGDSLTRQLDGVRREFGTLPEGDGERVSWELVLEAVASGDRATLADATLNLGKLVESSAHLNGAREFHRLAYDVAVAASEVGTAMEATRLHARSCRKLSDFAAAERWYERGLAIADLMEDQGKRAELLGGLATTYYLKGSYPRAKATLERQQRAAEESDNDYALAQCHHLWLMIEVETESWHSATAHGWEAFNLYEDKSDRFVTLLDLGHCFGEAGWHRSAEDAYGIVAAQTEQASVRALALVGLEWIAALKYDEDAFRQRALVADRENWMALPPTIRGDIEYYRGRSFHALGRLTEARTWLDRARRTGEEYDLHQVAIEAAGLLETLGQMGDRKDEIERESREDAEDLDVTGILHQLSDLREELSVTRDQFGPCPIPLGP